MPWARLTLTAGGRSPFSSRQQQQRLRDQAQMAVRAMDGWQLFNQSEDNADPDAGWSRLCTEAGEHYQAGGFLIEQLAAERYMDPHLIATIWGLRQRTIEELGLTTTPEYMLLDLAVISYFNAIRAQRWIGDLAMRIEHGHFGMEVPRVHYTTDRHGRERANRLDIEGRGPPVC